MANLRDAPPQQAPVLDADGIRRALIRLAHEIVESNQGIDGLVLAGIQRSGVAPMQRIVDEIERFEGRRPAAGTLDVTMHRDDLSRRGLETHPRPTELPDIDGHTVVLIDDVLYTGRTVRAAMDALNDYGRPRAIRLAVLVDRGHRELPIRADMVGKNIPTAREDTVRVLTEADDGRDAVIVVPGRAIA